MFRYAQRELPSYDIGEQIIMIATDTDNFEREVRFTVVAQKYVNGVRWEYQLSRNGVLHQDGTYFDGGDFARPRSNLPPM